MFNERILNRFTNPKYAGGLRGANGTGRSEDPARGDIIKIYISVNDENVIQMQNSRLMVVFVLLLLVMLPAI